MKKRYKFSDVFLEYYDETLRPKRTIKVGSATLGTGQTLNKWVVFGGVDFHQYKNFDIAADESGDILDIKGFYQ